MNSHSFQHYLHQNLVFPFTILHSAGHDFPLRSALLFEDEAMKRGDKSKSAIFMFYYSQRKYTSESDLRIWDK